MKHSIQTVRDLKDIVDHLVAQGKEDCSVGIIVKEEGVVLGPTPTVPIQWLSTGFDWDSGRVLIQPELPLKKADGLSQLTEIQNHYAKLIYEYEAGLSTIDDEETAFKSYLQWKQWMETSKAMALHYQLATGNSLTLSMREPLEQRAIRQIKRGLIPHWTIGKESEFFVTIERTQG